MASKSVVSSNNKNNKNSSSKLWIYGLIIGVLFVGIYWQRIQSKLSSNQNNNVQESKATPTPIPNVAPVRENEHIRGDKDAPITWIEYSDLECPYCAKIHPDIIKIMDEYKGKIRWVYRHFPLEQIHPSAKPLAYGAECVAKLKGEDAFWKYVDYVFEEKVQDPKKAAQFVGLSATEISSCLEDEDIQKRVSDDYQSGLSAGVRGTPGNFIISASGSIYTIPGALPYDNLKNTVEQALSN